jgi:hypothetical protein
MRNKQFALSPAFRGRGILNVPECSTHKFYSELVRFLIEPAAPRVLQDYKLNQIVYAEGWGLGGRVICDQTTGLELSNGILACNG